MGERVSRESYTDAVRALKGSSDGDPLSRADEVARRLLVRWRESHRGYHDEQHLAEVLAAVDELGELVEMSPRPTAVLAAWYHDAVYEGRPGEDEEASARLAESELAGLGVDAAVVAEVAALVRSTAAHELPEDPASSEAVLHDADLWILAAPGERFDEYCADVRREYAYVTDEDYARGRIAVLAPFVERERLYATGRAHEEWTGRARSNLARELARLRR